MAASPTSAPSARNWQNLLDQINTSGNFFRPKEGNSRIRLIPLPGMDYEAEGFIFWAEAITNFRGQERTKYVIPALVLEAKGAKPEMATTVTPVIISKQVLKQILSYLAEGYDFFGPNGNGLTLKRSGTGLDTDYAVMPSKSPVPVDEEAITIPELTIEEMALEYQTWANKPRTGTNDDDSGDDIPSGPRSGSARGNSTRRGRGEDW